MRYSITWDNKARLPELHSTLEPEKDTGNIYGSPSKSFAKRIQNRMANKVFKKKEKKESGNVT
jgi:hypothetical protein